MLHASDNEEVSNRNPPMIMKMNWLPFLVKGTVGLYFRMISVSSLWSEYQKAAENVYFPNPHSGDVYFEDAKQKILGEGTHAIVSNQLSPVKIKWLDARFGAKYLNTYGSRGYVFETGFGTWYRSRERVQGFYPFNGPTTTKNWSNVFSI